MSRYRGALIGAIAMGFWVGPAVAQTADAPLAGLGEAITAVLGEGADQRLLIIENDHGVSNTHSLAIGEAYGDGWTFQGVADGAARFRKGEAIQTVRLPDRLAGAATPIEVAVAGEDVAVTNAVEGERERIAPKPADLAAAIAAGDVRRIADLGGTAADVLNAYAAGSPLPPDLAYEPGSEAFVRYSNVYGPNQTGIRVRRPGGDTIIIAVDELNGFEPADGFPSPIRDRPAG